MKVKVNTKRFKELLKVNAKPLKDLASISNASPNTLIKCKNLENFEILQSTLHKILHALGLKESEFKNYYESSFNPPIINLCKSSYTSWLDKYNLKGSKYFKSFVADKFTSIQQIKTFESSDTAVIFTIEEDDMEKLIPLKSLITNFGNNINNFIQISKTNNDNNPSDNLEKIFSSYESNISKNNILQNNLDELRAKHVYIFHGAYVTFTLRDKNWNSHFINAFYIKSSDLYVQFRVPDFFHFFNDAKVHLSHDSISINGAAPDDFFTFLREEIELGTNNVLDSWSFNNYLAEDEIMT